MHSTDDLDDGYLGSGYVLQRSIKKYGKKAHQRVILEDCSKQGRSYLREREKELVTQEIVNDPMSLNIALEGGGTLETPSDETRKMMQQFAKGRTWTAAMRMSFTQTMQRKADERFARYAANPKLCVVCHEPNPYERQFRKTCSEEHRRLLLSEIVKCRTMPQHARDAIGRANKGRIKTPEECAKISAGNKGKKHSEELKRKISLGNKGKRHTEESKKLMSEVLKQRIAERGGFSDEHRRKLSESHRGQPSPMKGKKFSDEHRKNLAISQRRRYARLRALKQSKSS